MTTPLAARYLETLTDRLGLEALEDPDGDIVIRKGGLTFLARLDAAHDPEYLRVILSFPAPAQSIPQDALCTIANRVNRRQKGAWVTVGDEGQLVIAAEMLVAPPNCLPSVDYLAAVLPRVLSMLVAAARTLTTDLAILELEASLNE